MNYFNYIFLLVVLTACSKPEENYVKIPSQFYATIQEEIKPDSIRQLWLELSSMNSEYCLEDSLVYNTMAGNNSYSISILDSYKANDCFQRKYSLKSRIKLPSFTDSLQIQLNLGSASIINCSVFNYKNDIDIEINSGTGLLKKYDKTRKIPFNLIWGYAYPKSSGYDGTIQMNKFTSEIEIDCFTSWLPKGYYSYFSILDKNVLILDENPGFAGSYKNFYYVHTKTDEELNQFFIDLAPRYVNLVGYKINSGSGKEFNSN